MNYATRIVLGFLLTGGAAWAQTSQINGTVRDASGSAIPDATVKANQTATGAVRTATTGVDGGYVLTNLPVGPYVLEVTKDGFSKYAQMGLVLEVGTAPTIDVALKVGSITEQVTVEAGALSVETRSTSIGQVVDTQRVLEMPLNGREVHELIFLAGMANYPGGASLNTVRNYPTVVVSVAGGLPDAVGYQLDGVIHQDPYNNLSLPLPFPDALQEFNVQTSAIPAQYGYHSTAMVNAITKSGTNSFHGDLFEFLRNGDLNARDFFAAKRDSLKRNQFGGTIGGPIKKDKLFFFGGYQRTSLRSDAAQNTAFIPTPAMALGDFTGITAPSCNGGKQINLPASLGFNANKISPAALNPVAMNILATMPTTPDPCGRTLYGTVSNQDEDLYAAKVDYQINTKQSMFGRFYGAKLNQGSTFDGKDPLSIANYGIQDLDYGLVLGHTYLLSSNVVNALRLSASRTNIVKVPDNYKSWAALGANVSPLAGNIITVAATGEFNIGSGAASPGQSHNGPLWSIYDDINWIKGKHQIGIGGSIYQQRLNYFSGVNATGTATFDGSYTGVGGSASVLSDFMLGHPVTFAQGTIYGFYSRQFYGSMYIQDSWKITSHLTANYGVRWEPYLSVYQKYNHQDEHFDPALFAANVHSTYYQNGPAGVVFSGDPQYSCGNNFQCNKWGKFFPRVGLAWDPQGNGKMTIRAAYGMFQDRQSMLSMSQEQFGAPFGNNVSSAGATLTNPWSTFGGLSGGLSVGQNPMALLASLQGLGNVSGTIPFPTFGTYVTGPLSDFKPMYVNQWNLSLQRQMGKDWLLSANYLGTSTIHVPSGESVDPAIFLGLGACTIQGPAGPVNYPTCSTTANQNQRRLYYLQNPKLGQYFGGIGQYDDGGTASYEGLNLSVQKRMARGLNLLANYTYSHCISDPWNQNPTAAGVAIPGARRQWRSNCVGTDLRQLFTLSAVYATPKYTNKVLRILASDWQFAPIMTIKSAQFFSVLAGPDTALSAVPGQPASYLGGSPYAANQSVTQWLNPAAFGGACTVAQTQAGQTAGCIPLGTYGNLGLNNMKGPGVFQLNLALSRNFKIHEGQTLQVRAEAFNLPNHLNPFTPGIGPISTTLFGGQVNRNASNFGQITNDISGNNGLLNGDYRVVQLAMKFMF